MAEQEVSNTEQSTVNSIKAMMLEYVVPVLLGLLGFLGVQLLGKTEQLDTTNDRQDREIVALQRDVEHMNRELNRVRDKE